MAGIENIKMHSQPEFMAGQNVKYNNASNVQQDIRVSQLERVPDADELNTQNTGNTTKTDRLIGEIKDLFRVCYKSMKKEYPGESLVIKKNFLYRLIFK